ncbi:aldehyde dehydrogenase [Paenibacillus yanchengensis]|uniref:Aldehyde dehydrogenase n=1 Tax=Paenibacillus yanchengensis TaxID=2035833 RepID=A0ABW4YP20_9BACL
MQAYKLLIEKQRTFVNKGHMRSYAARKVALQQLANTIRNYEQQITTALHADLNKSAFEAYSSEIGIVLSEITFVLKRLATWMKPKKVRTPMTHLGSSSYIQQEPYGVALLISPWNFPFQLALNPLIGAVAAGNSVILKPSELTPHTSKVITAIIQETFAPEHVTVIEGGASTSTALLTERFDYIFYTGGEQVGKIVMEAAAKHLTPVSLELGGKSPCIVHEDANLALAAKRIAWGKFMNAGQACVAPDYIYIHQSVQQAFTEHLIRAIQLLYGEQPLQNENYAHIVSERHFDRLVAMMQEPTIAYGGQYDRTTQAIAPTILTEVSRQQPIMQEEIFGPLLPMLTYDDLHTVITEVRQHEKPLALYVFSESKQVQSCTMNELSFGGGCINDTVYHFTNPYLPFGGVGNSGIGAYHGQHSFQLFSHQKAVLRQTTKFDIPFRYPNLKNGLRLIKMFLK